MPYKNPEDLKKRDKDYYIKHKEEIKARARKRYQDNSSVIKKRRMELSTPEKKAINASRERKRYHEYRKIVVDAYGCECACCGEKESLFLELDHVNNDGWKHREEIGNSARTLVYWAIRNNFPDSIQILCSNCNQGKKRNHGICPHKQKKDQYCSQEKW